MICPHDNEGCGLLACSKSGQCQDPEYKPAQGRTLVLEGARAEAAPPRMALPTDGASRKGIPLATGCLYYFPAALAEVAKLSKIGNDKHNPGQPLHHARGKSTDHADCIIRHQIDVGTIDPDTGLDHAVMVAWRALAQLQELCEQRGAPLARGAKLP